MTIHSQRPAHPRRCHRRHPPPAVPGGQLLRRPAPGHARAPRPCPRARRCRPRRPSGPVQLDRVLSALQLQHPRRPADRCCRASAGRSTASRPRPRTPPRIPASGGSPPARRSTARSSTPPGRSRPRRSSTPRCWAASPTTSRARWPAARTRSRRWPRPRTTCADLVTTFNATMGALAARQDDLCEHDRAAAAVPARRRQRARPAPGLVRPHAAVRQGPDPERQAARRRRSPPALPWLAQSDGAALAPGARRPAELADPGDPGDLEHARSRPRRCSTASDAAGQVLRAHGHPHRQRADLRPAADDRPAGLPGAVPVRRRPGQLRPELRRQRALRALRGRRRLRPGRDRLAARRRPAVRQRRVRPRWARAPPTPASRRRSSAACPASAPRRPTSTPPRPGVGP